MARPLSEDPKRFFTIGIRESQLAWVALWIPGYCTPSDPGGAKPNYTRGLEELIDRAMKFWPKGPNAPGPVRTGDARPKLPRIPRSLKHYAARRQMSRPQALADIARRFLREHPEEAAKANDTTTTITVAVNRR